MAFMHPICADFWIEMDINLIFIKYGMVYIAALQSCLNFRKLLIFMRIFDMQGGSGSTPNNAKFRLPLPNL
ncbi:hypothetical protein AMR44_16720 [Shewanella algae]|nr:hypothetical protein AMR44_16720 [Shewanella algae]